MRFKVGRLVSGTSYKIVGESGLQSPVANTLNTYPVRIPVQAGDVLGFAFTGDSNPCVGGAAAGTTVRYVGFDPASGSTADFSSSLTYPIDISATLEADADGDGYGDETQDSCPNLPDVHTGTCDFSPPETTIESEPKSKVKSTKKTTYAEFTFASTKAGSSFECQVDGGSFGGCSSPLIVKAGKGTHQFAVRAIGPNEVTDPTPATYSWSVKVKKKHKKK
ncbi:MAG: hypothetical protein U0R24_09630 [Solirubrobacterales bacterium]